MTMMRALLVSLLLTLAGVAQAQTFPPLTGRVVDNAHILSAAQVAQLTAQSEAVEKASSRQLVIATIADLQGYPIEDYGYKLGRAWKIGQTGANNGIILIVAPNERKVRIEVGYGLEPIMTDALSSAIVADAIVPKFKAGDMAGGIIAGADAIAEQMKLPLEAAEARAAKTVQAAPRSSRRNGGGGVSFVVVIIVLFVVLPMLFRGNRGQRYQGSGIGGAVGNVVLWSALNSFSSRGGGSSWGGGGGGSDWSGGAGGGGGFSGGGGSFGGGGASGDW